MNRSTPLFAALVCAGALVSAVASSSTSLPVVKSIDIEGNQAASEVGLRHLADVRVGSSMLTLDLDRIVQGVTRHPWVKTVSVSRDLGRQSVRIRVDEHQTALLLMLDGLYRVSPDGEVFVRTSPGEVDAPLLTGIERAWVSDDVELTRALLNRAVEVVDEVDGLAPAGSRQDLSEVNFDSALGFTAVFRSGTRVRLGFGEPAEMFLRLKALQESGLDLDTPVHVDLDHTSMAVVTPAA